MRAIIYKNIVSYFSSFMKIFSLGLIVVILNIFIWVLPTSSILEYGYADLTMLFETLPYAIMFLIPSITMNLVVEDFEKGTSELLGTFQYLARCFSDLGKKFVCRYCRRSNHDQFNSYGVFRYSTYRTTEY